MWLVTLYFLPVSCAGGCMHLFCFLVSFASCVDKPQLISTSCQKSTCANGLLLAGLGEYHLCSSVICLTVMPNVSKSKSNSLWADKTAVYIYKKCSFPFTNDSLGSCKLKIHSSGVDFFAAEWKHSLLQHYLHCPFLCSVCSKQT